MIGTDKPARRPSVPGVELLEELGRGGMGVVYLGRQPKLDRPVAVKVLRSWTGADDELVERFLREARAAALTDVAIVPLYDVGVVDDDAARPPAQAGRSRPCPPARTRCRRPDSSDGAGLMGTVVLPRVMHPTASEPAPGHHRVTATVGPRPSPSPVAAATAPPASVPGPVVAAGAAASGAGGGTGNAGSNPAAATQGWSSLGGSLTSGAGMASWASNRMDVFDRGPDGTLWHKVWSGGAWSGYESLGGYIQAGSAPAAVSWGPNRIDVFVWGGDDALWHLAWDGSQWVGWQSLGGGITSSPAVASWCVGRLDVFARGGDGAVWGVAPGRLVRMGVDRRIRHFGPDRGLLGAEAH
ncbi:MAG: hypothetical protein J2P57_00030 [Acidimicrobiaceae bacterium]|nr:hypothetical protein [Acidimicrobiaceae bacterium]